MRAIHRALVAASLLVALAAGTTALPQPAVLLTPAFESSAPPVFFTHATYGYVLTVSVPSNWTELLAPPGFTLTGGPLSTQAYLAGTEASAGSQSFSVQATSAGYDGARSTWQNWSVTFVAEPYIASVPYFTPNAGAFYDYRPVLANAAGASWSFSGGSWLTLNRSTGEVSGTVAPGRSVEQLTLNTSVGQWTQSWYVSTVGLPSSITFSGTIARHNLTVTEPTSDATGLGNAGIFLGPLVQVQVAAAGDAQSYVIVVGAGGGFNVSYVGTTPTDGLSTNLSLEYYAPPGSGIFPVLNGVTLPSVNVPAPGSVAVTVTSSSPGVNGAAAPGSSGLASSPFSELVALQPYLIALALVALGVGAVWAITVWLRRDPA